MCSKTYHWLSAGLAASAMIPFIPNVYRSLKSKISREVPTVTRSFQRQVDANDLRRDQVIESAPDLYNNMKMLLKIHTKPSVLYKDFLARPLVNKINKNKNQEIV